jgi:hypothetical protein
MREGLGVEPAASTDDAREVVVAGAGRRGAFTAVLSFPPQGTEHFAGYPQVLGRDVGDHLRRDVHEGMMTHRC